MITIDLVALVEALAPCCIVLLFVLLVVVVTVRQFIWSMLDLDRSGDDK